MSSDAASSGSSELVTAFGSRNSSSRYTSLRPLFNLVIPSNTHSKANMIRERRERAEEKARLENMAAKMSAKKLQRMRKVSCRVVWEEWNMVPESGMRRGGGAGKSPAWDEAARQSPCASSSHPIHERPSL